MIEFSGVSIIRLQFDNLIIQKNVHGWLVHRDGKMICYGKPWETAWGFLTSQERSRCIVFANNLR